MRHLDFPIPKIDHAITYAHWEYNCASENVHTDMLYLDLNWLFFHSHIQPKVYDHDFTLDIHEKLSRLSTRVLWDLEEERWRKMISQGNMGQSNAFNKNPGSYQNNQWKYFFEMNSQQSAHNVLDTLKMSISRALSH